MNPAKTVILIGGLIVVGTCLLVIPVVHYKISPVAGTLLISTPALIALALLFIPTRKRKAVGPEIVCHDRYIELYRDRLVINGIYLGPFGRVVIPFDEIGKIEILRLKYGNWKRQGTLNEKIWFALDTKRSNNMDNFAVECESISRGVAFSVEDFDAVRNIFREKDLLTDT